MLYMYDISTNSKECVLWVQSIVRISTVCLPFLYLESSSTYQQTIGQRHSDKNYIYTEHI